MTGLFTASRLPEAAEGRGARTEIIRGNWPYTANSAGLGAQELPMEVALDTLGAELLGLDVGDEMDVFPASGITDPPPMRVTIVAVFRRTDPGDEFWYGARNAFSFKNDRWTTVPLFTTEDAILERVAYMYPGVYSEVAWFFYLDRQGVRARDVGHIQDSIVDVEYDVRTNLTNSGISVGLDEILDDYEERLLLARIPLFLMVFLVTGILIYYLGLVAGLIVRSRATEISMLNSRGATTFQIGLLALVEGLFLALPAVALGPLLALGVSRALGRVFFDFSAGSGGLPPVSLSADAYLLGAGGALLAVAVLTISTLVAARRGIVAFRHGGARPPRAPFIHRYYVDILVLVLAMLILWQLQSRGSFLVRSVGTGELTIDFSLLFGPVLLLLVLGLLVLRAFPWALAVLARALGPPGPAWLAQGLRRVSRDPIIPGTLVVLIMLATALGVIGSAFSSTLERSQRDRALYAAGADLRIEHGGDGIPLSLLGLSGRMAEVDGVEDAMEVKRTSGSLLTRGFSTTGVSVLAVDTVTLSQVAWYRPGFGGGKSLEELTRAIAPDGQGPENTSSLSTMGAGIRLPKGATGLALWVHPTRPDFSSFIKARLEDARGYYFDVFIGTLDFRSWRRLEAELTPLQPSGRRYRDRSQMPELTPPFTLLSLLVTSRFDTLDPGLVFLGELTAVTPDGTETLADFQTLDGWRVLEDYSRPGLSALESSESAARTAGSRSAAFSWSQGGVGLQGIKAGGPEPPIPAVVSESLLEAAEAEIGDTLNISVSTITLPIQATVAAEFFPTLKARQEPFVVVDLRTLNHYMNLHTDQSLVGGSNELWVSLDGPRAPGDPDRTRDVIEALDGRGIDVVKAHVASELVSQQVEQPLVNAGWGGLLVLMFLTLVLASASGVMLYSYVDIRERQTEFALLRTLGFSRGQLNGVLWLNLVLIVLFGVGLGTWAGYQIGATLLPLLEVAEGGVRVTPPMVLHTNWTSLLVSYSILAGVAVSTLVWLAWLATKLEVQKVLRIGEA